MTDNPLAMEGDCSLVVETNKTADPWEDLRKQAKQTKEAVVSMDTAHAFVYCVDNFLINTKEVAEVNIDVRSAVGGFQQMVESELAGRIAKDELMVASIPGKNERRVVTIDGRGQPSVSDRLKMHLRETSWLETGDAALTEGLKTSLLHILAASFGVDPGPVESIRPVKEIGGRLMRGEFNESDPPAPFSKSHIPSELQIRTSVSGVTFVLDQTDQLFLCLEPDVVKGIVEGSNKYLEGVNIQSLPKGGRDEVGLVGRKTQAVTDFLTKS